ncbi:MAG: radical SAM protein [Pseudomonadota bacterium]
MNFLFINVNHDVGFESSESIPISLGYILAALKGRGWDGIILDDLRDKPLTLRVLERWLQEIQPVVVGFTAYQSTMERIRFLSRYIKTRHKRVLVAIGGPQAVLMPSAALDELEDVDIIVRGDGETVMTELAGTLQSGGPLNLVPGITFRSQDGVVDNPPADNPVDLDAYPSPYLTDVLNLYGKDTAILLSSRGCSHVCWFCITPSVCKGKVRYHSIRRALQEMQHLADAGISRFWFADPSFTENRPRVEELLKKKIELGVTTPFWFQTRADLVDAGLLELFRKAGADTVAFGLESGSPGVLARTNKRIDLDQVRDNVRIAKSLGMEAELFSIFGLPGETVEDAGATLDFVRSLEIPILSNLGSQQMQLYFGSAYSKSPQSFGIKPSGEFRPAYMSVGDQYETDSMSRADMKRVRNMWALANEGMERDVYFKQRIFELLDFLLENRSDFEDEPNFFVYGALASSAIEEYGMLEEFLVGYHQLARGDETPVKELISSLSFFRRADRPAGPMDRVIFDSRSWMDDVPFTGISGRYWDVLLGRGLLLEEFERNFVGVREGAEKSFQFTFPEDYGQEDLRGKTVRVNVKIHKVLESIDAATIEDVRSLVRPNRYAFPDLDVLEDQNEILYYLALRDANTETLLETPSHFLALIYRLAKLGKREEVEGLARMLDQKPTALRALADTVAKAGKPSWSLNHYSTLSETMPSTLVRKATCVLNMDNPRAALEILNSIPPTKDVEYYETLLECLKLTDQDRRRIDVLDRRVMDLRVDGALLREKLMKHGGPGGMPIVHGLTDD